VIGKVSASWSKPSAAEVVVRLSRG
jgi:hypothetical protein